MKDNKLVKQVFCLALVAILFNWSLQNLSSVGNFFGVVFNILLPIVLGLVLAFIINLPMDFFERKLFNKTKNRNKKMERSISLILSFFIVISIVVGLTILVVPQVVNAIALMVEALSNYIPELEEWIRNELNLNNSDIQEIVNGLSFNFENLANSGLSYISSNFSSAFGSAIGFFVGLVGGVTNFILGIIFAIYILVSKEILLAQFKKLFEAILDKKNFVISEYVAKLTNKSFSKFLVGQATEAVILGVLCFIGMMIFRFPYAGTISALLGVLSLIPIVGGLIGGAVGAFLIFTISPIQSVWFVVFVIVLQQLEGNLIYPKVVGKSIGLPGLWVLVGVTLGGSLWGILGMLIMVPLMSVIYSLVRLYIAIKKLMKDDSKDGNKKMSRSYIIKAIKEIER